MQNEIQKNENNLSIKIVQQPQIISSSFNHMEDKCKIYLAEIYTLNKKNEKLNSEFEEKLKIEIDLRKKINDLDTISNQKISQYMSKINEQNILIENLLFENESLKKNHSYNELIDYYEKRIEEIKEKNKNSSKALSKMIERITQGKSGLNNRDDVWKNLVKKYENKIFELESEISELKKAERKIFLRKIFFDKYCIKAEEKIEEISKVSKKFYDQESLINKLKSDLETIEKENNLKKDSSMILLSENSKLRNENKKYKNFLSKLNPILKIDWDNIKKENEEIFSKNENFQEKDIEKKNIIILIENLKKFLLILKDTIKISADININQISSIVEDIKIYTMTLLKKIHSQEINQYNIINTCCDLNDKLKIYSKTHKAGLDFLTVLKDVKYSCSKLLFDYSPN